MDNIIGWKYQRDVSRDKTDLFESVLEQMATAIDIDEIPTDMNSWRLTVFFDASASRQQLLSALSLAEKVADIEDITKPVALQPVVDEDWQQSVVRSFPPINEGRFFIYGFEEQVPDNLVGLHIPAGMAFGTGEHATTALCLHLYEQLIASNTFVNGLDMGAGSGILAIAAAKVQKTKFIAVDNDQPSVEVCQENVHNNGVEELVTSMCGDGFKTLGVPARKPYDIIFANILRNPLLEMSETLVAHLKEGGYCILSGFTEDQLDDIRNAYTELGLTEVKTMQRKEWCAVSLQLQK